MNQVIAIVGMAGSGKSVASNYFEKKGYERIHFGSVIMNKLQEENMEVNPQNEKIMRERLRQEHGMGVIAKLLLPTIKEKLKEKNVVLDSLYSWEEFLTLQQEYPHNLRLIGILADKQKRYERMQKRKIRPFTPKEAKERDISEIENLTKGGVIAFADYYIYNSGNLDDYYQRLDEIIKTISKEGGKK